MSSNLVNFRNFKIENLIIGSVQKKTSVADKSATYYEIPLSYKYERCINGKNAFIIDDLYIEFPELTSNGGIIKKINEKSGKTEASIMASFNISDQEINEFTKQGSYLEEDERGTIGKIYYSCLDAIFEQKGQIPSFSKTQKVEFLEALVTQMIYWPTDDQGMIVAGKNPVKYFNLINQGEPGTKNRRETLFNYPSKDDNGKIKKISWECLENVKMKFIPNVKIPKIYIGQKASIQVKIESAIVTEINRIGDISSQTETLERLMESRPDISKSIEESLNSIKQILEIEPNKSENKEEKQKDHPDDIQIDIESLPGLKKNK